jgi:hypothetical protein
MSKAFSHKTRRWPLAVLAASLALAAGLNKPVPAQTGALPQTQAGSPSALVWIGTLAGGVVPMRPVEFVWQDNGDLLIKGGAVVKAAPMTTWPVLRGGAGSGHFFMLAPSDARGGGVYWLMDFADRRRPPGR